MLNKMTYRYIGSRLVSNFLVILFLLFITKPTTAVEARKPELSLAERILQQKNPQRESFFGDVKLLHSPNPIDVQFSADGSVLFSLAETVRMWRSDTGAYLGSIAGPARFNSFAQINNSRWIVTIDELERPQESDWRFSIPQVLPYLRVWDVATGSCLAVRNLNIPANGRQIWFSTLATADQHQMTYVIVHYEVGYSYVRKLVGYHGQTLIPAFQLELDHDFGSLVWDPHASQLYLYGASAFSCYDPASNKISWMTNIKEIESLDTMTGRQLKIDQIVVVDQPFQINKGKSDRKMLNSTILLTFHSTPTILQSLNIFNLNEKLSNLLVWGLVDPHSGKPIKSGVVPRNLKPGDKRPNQKKEDTFIYWLRDREDQSIKAVNILKNQLQLTIPRNRDNVVSLSRYKAEYQKWYLEREDDRTSAGIILWNQVTNRVCSIRGDSEEIELFDSKTANPVASASGTVNALSKFSDHKISASMDWNDVSVYEFKSGGKFVRTFNTNVLPNSCVALSADASNLLVGGISGKAHLWSLSNHKKIATLTGGTNKLLCLAANAAHKIIVACDNEGIFWWWKFPAQATSLSNKTQLLKAEGNNKPTALTLLDDPKINFSYLISRSLCDLSTDALHTLSFEPLSSAHEVADGEFFFGPGDNFITKVTGNPLKGGYNFFKPIEGVVIATNEGHKPITLTPAVNPKSVLLQIKISADGRFAMFVFDTGQVIMIDQKKGVLESIVQTGNREIVDVNYHPDQKTLLVASFRGTVTAWNSETFLKAGSLQLRDARLNLLSSRATDKDFDIVLGTWDTGLIVKAGVFSKSEQKPLRPAALTFPFE